MLSFFAFGLRDQNLILQYALMEVWRTSCLTQKDRKRFEQLAVRNLGKVDSVYGKGDWYSIFLMQRARHHHAQGEEAEAVRLFEEALSHVKSKYWHSLVLHAFAKMQGLMGDYHWCRAFTLSMEQLSIESSLAVQWRFFFFAPDPHFYVASILQMQVAMIALCQFEAAYSRSIECDLLFEDILSQETNEFHASLRDSLFNKEKRRKPAHKWRRCNSCGEFGQKTRFSFGKCSQCESFYICDPMGCPNAGETPLQLHAWHCILAPDDIPDRRPDQCRKCQSSTTDLIACDCGHDSAKYCSVSCRTEDIHRHERFCTSAAESYSLVKMTKIVIQVLAVLLCGLMLLGLACFTSIRLATWLFVPLSPIAWYLPGSQLRRVPRGWIIAYLLWFFDLPRLALWVATFQMTDIYDQWGLAWNLPAYLCIFNVVFESAFLSFSFIFDLLAFTYLYYIGRICGELFVFRLVFFCTNKILLVILIYHLLSLRRVTYTACAAFVAAGWLFGYL